MNRTLAAQFGQDLRHGLRVFSRHPAFSLSTILTLALGVGANTAVFALLDGLLLRPLPVSNPHELVRLTTRGEEIFGFEAFDQIRQGSQSLSAVIAVQNVNPTSGIEDETGFRYASVHAVSADCFPALGISASVGCVFAPSDAAWGDDNVAVVSQAYRRTRSGESTEVIGSRIRYLNRDFTVIGVTPQAFTGTIAESPADVWVPLTQVHAPESEIWTRARFLKIMGRLSPGATPETALAEAAALVTPRYALGVEPGANGFSSLRQRFTRPVLILQTLVALVLIVACANLANLALARGASRQREIAIRLAIGASRGRLIRQLATESLVLSVAGGVLALGVAMALTPALVALLPPAFAGAAAHLVPRLDRNLLLFAGALSLLTAVAFGLAPAIRATARGGATLRTGLTDPGGRSLTSRGLVICAVAMSLVLVVGAGLFVGTLRNLWNDEHGFAAKDLVVAEVAARRGSLPNPVPSQYEDLLARVRGLDGVKAAGYTRIGQLTGGAISFDITLPGERLTRAEAAERELAIEQRISPGLLEAMGTSVLSGRDLADSDTADAPPVALVNETFVRRYFQGRHPLGQSFATSIGELRVVGVVQDTKWMHLREAPRPMFYKAARQSPPPGATFALRTQRPIQEIAELLRQEARAAGLSFRDIVPFTELVNRTLVTERMLALLSAGIGLLALIIVAVGLYGVLAYTVARRTSELGIRRALGATNGSLQWLVLRESLWLFGLGVSIGMIGVTVAAPAAGSLLFGLAPVDARTVAGAMGVLLAVTLGASFGPALRASRVDPLVALRTD